MKKVNLFAGIACLLAFLVAGVLVALGKYPVVSEMEHDELNQLSLLWVLVVTGLNFFIYGSSLHPVLDRLHNVTRLLAALCGVAGVVSYFTESQYGFEPRFLLQSSFLLGVISIGFYFLFRHFDSEAER